MAENRPYFVRADRNIPMHLIIKTGAKIWKYFHLPSFRFSWKLNKLCRVDFFVFESWQNAEDVMVLPCDFTAVCHDSKTKKSIQQNFFNFQENLNES
jgi:hypothetical protein